MKVRIRFSKEGPVKFIGHLDTMRYFQKAVRRAGLPAAFSGGYSPHMILSFASPLGVGVSSVGEYFDLELAETVPLGEIREKLNQVMAEGFQVLSVRKIPDGKGGNAMSLVAAADYLVSFREGWIPSGNWKEKVQEFMALPSIPALKKTKKGQEERDIRPWIYRMELSGEAVFLRLASASSNFTKPELVMDTFLTWLGEEAPAYCYQVHRLEVYADTGTEQEHCFVSLEDLGEDEDKPE